jgi:uncharacterized membrane protein (UPF0127 family)
MGLRQRVVATGRVSAFSLGLALSAACLGIAGLGIASTGEAVAEAPLQRVEIDTTSGAHVFQVEIARSAAERERGLMDRRSMDPDHGMLFDFQREQPVIFWMKDTYIPLDMIFVGRTGRVVAIKHDAKPMDETLIPSGAPTLGVIELNAGVAEAIGLKLGDQVKNPIFQSAAASP